MFPLPQREQSVAFILVPQTKQFAGRNSGFKSYMEYVN